MNRQFVGLAGIVEGYWTGKKEKDSIMKFIK
jgi:hypothetical protein